MQAGRHLQYGALCSCMWTEMMMEWPTPAKWTMWHSHRHHSRPLKYWRSTVSVHAQTSTHSHTRVKHTCGHKGKIKIHERYIFYGCRIGFNICHRVTFQRIIFIYYIRIILIYKYFSSCLLQFDFEYFSINCYILT